MPEGPEIKVMSDFINQLFKGKQCFGIKITEKSRYWKTPLAFFSREEWISFEDAINIHFSEVLKTCYSKGKKIIFDFGDYFFVSSCGLEGHWQLEKGNNTGIEIVFEDISIFYDDSRHFGTFHIVENLDTVLKAVGPDYLNGEVSLSMFKNKIREKRLAKKEIVSFLMNQAYFS